eukprot:GHRR01014669.1.p2 GENE.GHRR01014669.1~~GHRR01014669.1.p2  ORF type:complete len:139 (+),score=53.16 GHRR01014669.1:593-1009(+)
MPKRSVNRTRASISECALQRPRVLTAAFKTAAEQHGFEVVALDARDVSQWQQADPDVLVHKVPEDAGLDAKLIAYRQSHPHVVIVDHPAAVRLLQDRATMLKPLQDKDLVITQAAGQVPPQQHQQPYTPSAYQLRQPS